MPLYNLYKAKKNEEVIVWTGDAQHDGFSVIRDYPADSRFVPVKKHDGTNDTKILIKVGYALDAVHDNKVALFVSVGKFESYLSNRVRYDFDSPESPNQEAVDNSNRSPQPLSLSDRARYTLDTQTQSIYDAETKKSVSLNDIVEMIYGLHVKTISSPSGAILKSKLGVQTWVCNSCVPTIETGLKWINERGFGKTLVDDRDDWLGGLLAPYKHSRLTTLYPHTIPFFPSTSQISKAAIVWVSFAVLLGHYLIPQQWALDSVSSAAAVILLVFLFDSWIPHFILGVVNVFIRFRMWYGQMSFKIK